MELDPGKRELTLKSVCDGLGLGEKPEMMGALAPTFEVMWVGALV